jgi:chromate reductase
MTTPIRVLAFGGSLRRDSWNKKVALVLADGAREAGADVTVLDLRDVPMPPYDGDLEAEIGLPDGAKRFKELLIAHDAVLLSSPEYNSSIPGVLKNAIDWASRAEPGEKPLAAFEGKVTGLASASPGALGGLRALITVRAILGHMRMIVVPEQVSISKAHEAFDADGRLRDAKQADSVRRVAARVVHVARALAVSG